MKLDVEGREVKPIPLMTTKGPFLHMLVSNSTAMFQLTFPLKVDIVPDLVMSGALSHIDSLMVDWTDDFKDGMQFRPQVDFDRGGSVLVLVTLTLTAKPWLIRHQLIRVGITLGAQVELIRKLRKSIEGLVQVGLSIGLHHVTEVMLLKHAYKLINNNLLKFSGCSSG